jgi:hypothetical protein
MGCLTRRDPERAQITEQQKWDYIVRSTFHKSGQFDIKLDSFNFTGYTEGLGDLTLMSLESLGIPQLKRII